MAIIEVIDQSDDEQDEQHVEEKCIITKRPSSLVPDYEGKLSLMLQHLIPKVQEQLSSPTACFHVFIKVSNSVKEMIKLDREIKEKYSILKEILQQNSNDAVVDEASNILKTILEMKKLMTARYCELKDMIDGNRNLNTGGVEVCDILKAVLEMDRDMKSQYFMLKYMFEENLNQNPVLHKDREDTREYCILDPNLNVVLSKIAGDVKDMSLLVGEMLATMKMQLEKTDFPSIFCSIICLCINLLAGFFSWSAPETKSNTSKALECAVLCCIVITFCTCLIPIYLFSTKTFKIFGRELNAEVLNRWFIKFGFLGIIFCHFCFGNALYG